MDNENKKNQSAHENEPEKDMDDEETGTMKQWLQDNLRIIISILIVIAIAGGIYSYSKRSEIPVNELAENQIGTEESISGNIGEGTTIENNQGVIQGEVNKPAETTQQDTTQGVKENQPVQISQETETAFIETAQPGDGLTHLARKALADYLEKNPDSTLSPEHKIYIEDYLRKNIPPKRVFKGTTVEFSKDLIKQAIEKSKTLNENQLKNLHKYAVLVPSLT